MNTAQEPYITVPLDREIHTIAEKFAAQQATPKLGKQVYLNTLAVYAVHSYLNWLRIPTDLPGSDSWHPELQVLSDIADLLIPGIGKLECCPVLPGENSFLRYSEITEDRIGYVAVQFGQTLDQVKLLGFIRPCSDRKYDRYTKPILLTNLPTLEILLDYISDLIEQKLSSNIPVN